jgi:hypothetical protein
MKEVFRKIKKSHLQIQSAALIALQEATKITLITNFADERTRESFHCELLSTDDKKRRIYVLFMQEE